MFKELPVYNALIEKPYIKHLNNNNIDMLRELPFYDELNIVKASKTFKGYARSYSTEKINSNERSAQLTISKPSIKYLFKDLSDEIKGFNYQITLKVLLIKLKGIEIEILLLFILELLLKQQLVLNVVLANLFKNFLMEQIIRLVKDQIIQLNQ